MKPEYPVEYSLAEIVYVDGTTTSFIVKAGVGIARYLAEDLRDKQAITLRNDTDVLIIPREQLRSFIMRAMTKENN
jgi:hypothetical protein